MYILLDLHVVHKLFIFICERPNVESMVIILDGNLEYDTHVLLDKTYPICGRSR